MRWDIVNLSAASVGVGLGTIYLVFLAHTIALSNWSSSSEIPLLIFLSLALRLAVVIGFSKYINKQPVIAYILLSFEVFLIPVLALLQLWTGNPAYEVLLSVILTSWIGASAILISPYAIYEFAKGLTRTSSLLGVLAIGTFQIAGMLFLASVAQASGGPINSPANLGRLIIQTTKYSSGTISSVSASDIALAAAMVLFFVSTVAYVSLGRVSTKLSIGLSKSILIPFGGIVAAVMWVFALSTGTSDMLLVFTIPILTGVVTMWVVTRGN